MKSKNNTSYEDYLEQMKQEISARTGKRAILQTIKKNNGLVLDGLTILAEESNVSPSIYLNRYYKEFLTDGLEKVAEKVIALYEANKVEHSFDMSLITDLSKVKNKIKMKLINYEKNRALLETVPYIQILDLAVVFMIVLETEDEYQFGTILVHNGFLDYWKTEADSLYEIAKENMANDFQTIAMEDIATAVMDETLVEEMGFDIYLLTIYSRIHGAIGMLQTELLNAIMKKYETEKLIILPSSIHEVLLIPCNEETEEIDFKAMVHEVNVTSLTEEEFLSDSVYIYDGNKLKFFE